MAPCWSGLGFCKGSRLGYLGILSFWLLHDLQDLSLCASEEMTTHYPFSDSPTQNSLNRTGQRILCWSEISLKSNSQNCTLELLLWGHQSTAHVSCSFTHEHTQTTHGGQSRWIIIANTYVADAKHLPWIMSLRSHAYLKSRYYYHCLSHFTDQETETSLESEVTFPTFSNQRVAFQLRCW